jgi:hypothetical protein
VDTSEIAGIDMSVASAVATKQAVYTARMPTGADQPLVRALRAGSSITSVELRPPRAELDAAAGMDAWIDTYHAVSGFVRGRCSCSSPTAPSARARKTICATS